MVRATEAQREQWKEKGYLVVEDAYYNRYYGDNH